MQCNDKKLEVSFPRESLQSSSVSTKLWVNLIPKSILIQVSIRITTLTVNSAADRSARFNFSYFRQRWREMTIHNMYFKIVNAGHQDIWTFSLCLCGFFLRGIWTFPFIPSKSCIAFSALGSICCFKENVGPSYHFSVTPRLINNY